MTRQFTVFGKIRGQGRPRAFSRGKFTSVYKAKDDRLYESLIAEAYIHDCGNPEPFGEVPLELKVDVEFSVPKAFSKKKREQATGGWIFPTKKPDADNILKSIFDALTGVAYPDDKFIIDVRITQRYGKVEKMKVEIRELNSAPPEERLEDE